MQNNILLNFLKNLLAKEKIADSSMPLSVKESNEFDFLTRTSIIQYVPAGVGGNYVVKDKQQLELYFAEKFSGRLQQEVTSFTNVKTFSNSKARKRNSQRVILLRGTSKVIVNGKKVELKNYTTDFGIFATILNSLECPKICFVENLDCFLIAEQVIPEDYILVHTYGRLGAKTLDLIAAKDVLIFPDYDYIGLHEYLLLKEKFFATDIFVPTNYDELHKKYGRTIKTKHGREQKPSNKVMASNNELVVKILRKIQESGRYLEQQAVFR